MYSVRLSGLGNACTPQYLDYQCVSCCTPQPTQVATPAAPAPEDPRVTCTNLFNQWIKDHPAYVKCANRDEIINLCIAWRTGRMTLAQALAAQEKALDARCGTQFRAQCEKDYQASAAKYPTVAACITPALKEEAMQACIKAKKENWSQAKIDAASAALLARVKCPTPVATPPAPVAPPVQAAPPPAPPPPPEPLVEPPAVIMMDEPEPAPPPPSTFRKWGPILGIGLVIAAGVYYVGKKPTKKRSSGRRAAA